MDGTASTGATTRRKEIQTIQGMHKVWIEQLGEKYEEACYNEQKNAENLHSSIAYSGRIMLHLTSFGGASICGKKDIWDGALRVTSN